jgi:hypothetical protein
MNDIVTSPNGGYVAYNTEFISIDPKRIAIPTAEINKYLRISYFSSKAEAAKKAKLKNRPPICLVDPKIIEFIIANDTGEEDIKGWNMFRKYISNGNKK